MKEIELPSGEKCQVDDIDYQDLVLFKWYRKRINKNVYAQTHFFLPNGKRISINMHRMLLPKEKEIDHWDNNGLNNQRNNLRPCIHADNMKNRPNYNGRYVGVLPYGSRWLAKIRINQRTKQLGIFSTEIEAAKAYNTAAINTGNRFYKLNSF
jgi:hypothetical protein